MRSNATRTWTSLTSFVDLIAPARHERGTTAKASLMRVGADTLLQKGKTNMHSTRLGWICISALVLCVGFWGFSSGGAGKSGEGTKSDAPPRYQVVHSEGFNLIV